MKTKPTDFSSASKATTPITMTTTATTAMTSTTTMTTTTTSTKNSAFFLSSLVSCRENFARLWILLGPAQTFHQEKCLFFVVVAVVAGIVDGVVVVIADFVVFVTRVVADFVVIVDACVVVVDDDVVATNFSLRI